MDVAEALAICLTNLKGSRNKDLLKTAQALAYLRSQPEFGSNSKVGRAVGVSGEIVREFLALLSLPEPIQGMLKNRELMLEHGRRLSQLARRRPDCTEAAADAMRDLTALEGRYLVEHLLRDPKLSVEEAKARVVESRTISLREYHIVAMLPEDEYRRLAEAAKHNEVAVSALVTRIVSEWLEARRTHG